MGKPGTARILDKALFNVKPLKLRPPIEPLAHDVQTPENHPLWQFFGEQKSFLRTRSELEDIGRPWTIPQLRRKEFDDLHTLWYVCLKERNRLYRESQLLQDYTTRVGEESLDERNTAVDSVDKMVKTTMSRIRHVLAERYHSFKRTATFELESSIPKLLAEFRHKYLETDRTADSHAEGMLERFQFAFYGINPRLEDNIADAKVIEGLYSVAELKLQKYYVIPQASEVSETLNVAKNENETQNQDIIKEVKDIREAFLIFGAESSDEGILSAVETIKEIRESNEPLPKSSDTEVLTELMYSTKEAV